MTNKNFGLPDALINAVREIVNEKKDIYAAMKARQFAKSAVKEKDPIKKAEHEKKSDEYKAKINKEEVEALDKNIKTFIGKKIKIHQPGTSMHNMTGKVIWSNKEGSHHEVKLDQGKNAVHGFPTSAIKEEVELAEVAIEKNLEDHHPRIVSGVKGVKSTSFTKKFANHKAMEKWMDSDDGTHEIHRIEKDHNRIKEEAEVIDELSKKTLGSYIKKATHSAGDRAYEAGAMAQKYAGEPISTRPDNFDDSRRKAVKRMKGVDKAADRLAKEEVDIQESMKLVKTHTLGDHSAKVYKDSEWGEHRVKFYTGNKHHAKADYHTDDIRDAHDTAHAELKRMHAKGGMKEEVEVLDELSSTTRSSYRAKAKNDINSIRKQKEVLKQVKSDDPDIHAAVALTKNELNRKQRNRSNGILNSTRKEEVELSVEELARINEIEKNFDEGIIGGVASLTKNAVKVPVKAAVRVGKGAIHAVGAVAGGVKDTVDDIKKAGSDVKKAFKK